MKILILGHQGFIASHLIKFLNKKGYKVRTIPREYDLRNYEVALNGTKNIDFCFLMASNMGGIGYFSKANYYPVIDNYLIDLNILRACEQNKVKRLFYPASACAYNTDFMNSGAELEEEMLDWPAKPDQMYGWEKLSMIKLMRNSPVDCRVGILHTIYGEGQDYKGEKAKFPPQIAYKMIKACESGVVNVWGDGKQTRTFIHIDDAIAKIYEVMMMDKYYGEVNIGSDKEVSVNEVIDICCDILEVMPEIEYDITKPTGPTRRLCSNEKFNKYYKTRDKVSLKEGFERLINYIKRYES